MSLVGGLRAVAMLAPLTFALAMCASRAAAPPSMGAEPRLLIVTATASTITTRSRLPARC